MKLLPWRTWLDQFETETAHLGERLLGMDRHAPQKTPTFRAQMTTDNIVPVYTPPDCTDCVAPVDHHVGARLKQIMGLFYHLEVEAHRDSWCMPPGLTMTLLNLNKLVYTLCIYLFFNYGICLSLHKSSQNQQQSLIGKF